MGDRQQCLGHSGNREFIVIDDHDAGRAGILANWSVAAAELAANPLADAQFLHHPLQPHERADAGEQRDIVHRLGQEIVGAGLEAAQAVGGVGKRRDHDDRNIDGSPIGLQLAANLEPVHPRHHDVEKNYVRKLGLGDFQGGGPVIRRQNIEVLARQLCVEQFYVRLDIIDNQYSARHRSLALEGSGRSASSGEEALDGLQKARHRNRLRDIGLATTVPHLLLVAFHRKRGHRDDRDHPQISVSLDPLRDLQTGYFRQLDVHQNQIRMMLTRQRKRLDTVLGLQCTIAVSNEKIVEELHIEVVILDDQHLLPYRSIALRLRFCNVQCHAPSLESDKFCRNRRFRTGCTDAF